MGIFRKLLLLLRRCLCLRCVRVWCRRRWRGLRCIGVRCRRLAIGFITVAVLLGEVSGQSVDTMSSTKNTKDSGVCRVNGLAMQEADSIDDEVPDHKR